jgi:beta-lactamase superfamily II metal-dependent hydrolase
MKKRNLRTLVTIAIAIFILISAVIDNRIPGLHLFGPVSETKGSAEEGSAEVHFLDTGQSDCILILTEESAVLIDAGASDQSAVIADYLEAQGVETIDLLIATHPHADHIGAMADVLQEDDPETFILWHLDLLHKLSELRQFEKSQMDGANWPKRRAPACMT